MIVFKTHDRTDCAGLWGEISRWIGRARRLRFGFGGFLSDYIDSHTGGVEVEVVEVRSGSIILF